MRSGRRYFNGAAAPDPRSLRQTCRADAAWSPDASTEGICSGRAARTIQSAICHHPQTPLPPECLSRMMRERILGTVDGRSGQEYVSAAAGSHIVAEISKSASHLPLPTYGTLCCRLQAVGLRRPQIADDTEVGKKQSSEASFARSSKLVDDLESGRMKLTSCG